MTATLAAERRVAPRTLFQFIAVTLIWGSTWLVIKHQLGVVPPAWSVAYRFAIAGTVLLAICLVTRQWVRPSPRAHLFALVAGAMQFAFNFNLVYAAEGLLTSGLVSLIFALLIVPNALFARIFVGVPVSRRFIVGSAVGVAGLVLVFAPDLLLPGGNARATAFGVALTVGAVLSSSVANVMQASKLARSLPALPTLALTMLYGAALDATLAVSTAGPPVFDLRPEYWVGLIYLAIVASVVAFSLYYSLIRTIGPGPAAYSSVLTPVVAMTLSTLFEAYVWTPLAAAGGALALFGLALALGGQRQARKPAL